MATTNMPGGSALSAMPAEPDFNPFTGVDFNDLEKSLRRPRTLINVLLTWVVAGMTLVALVPLFSVIWLLVWRGGRRLSLALFTQLPPVPMEQGGGFGNAIEGTVIIVGLAMLISVPIGVLSAVYMSQTKDGDVFSTSVRFAAKVLTGFPSILAGVFAYGVVVLVTGGYSAIAGAVAVSILMLPTIMLTAEDAIRMVPAKMREAAIGMGATPTQTTLMVLLPTAFPGILTGVMLAVARAAGETAPLLFTSLFSAYWPYFHHHLRLMRPTASLAVLIYNFSGMPFKNQVEMAWAAALVMVLMVLVTNLLGQAISRRQMQSSERTHYVRYSFGQQPQPEKKPHADNVRGAINHEVVIDCQIDELYYGPFKAVRDTTIPVKKNHITAFIGPSGCGKSTVLRCLNRMNDLVRGFRFEGHVHFRGKDIYHPSVDAVAVRRFIGMVFQQPNPFATSIFNNVAFGLRLNNYKGDKHARVEEALKRAALWDEVKDKLGKSGLSLSGGQQQRLCIARAIATEPEVLLMDEPCSALDPIATRKIEELMLELKTRYTIAIVTHNLHQALRVADLTGFLYVDTTQGGRTGYLVEFGDSKQLFEDPKEKHTKEYIRGEFS